MSFDPKKPRQVIDQMIFEEVKSLPCESDNSKSDELEPKLQSRSANESGSFDNSQPTYEDACTDGFSLNSDLHI